MKSISNMYGISIFLLQETFAIPEILIQKIEK